MSEHNDAAELKPCPFCGQSNIKTELTITDRSVWCGNCGVRITRDIDDLQTPEIVWNARAGEVEGKPIDVVLFCPKCKAQHFDDIEPDVCEKCGGQKDAHKAPVKLETGLWCDDFTPWLNPPHKSHRCHNCNTVWRPADMPTNGVEKVQTVGSNDTKD